MWNEVVFLPFSFLSGLMVWRDPLVPNVSPYIPSMWHYYQPSCLLSNAALLLVKEYFLNSISLSYYKLV